MGRIKRECIDEVCAKTDIVALVNEYVELTSRGKDFWGCCPFHHEKTPSFSVNAERKMYYCFACHAGGSPITFYRDMEKVSYVEAVKELARRCGVQLQYEEGSGPADDKDFDEQNKLKSDIKELYKRLAGTFHFFLQETDAGKKALAYLLERGLSIEIIRQFQLGFAPENRKWLKTFLLKQHFSNEFLAQSGLFSKKYPDIAFFSKRIMFPIWNSKGEVVAFGGRVFGGDGPKYLNSSDMIQYKKSEIFYAFNFAKERIRQEKSAILCEGYMDAIAYHQAGITNAIATCGTSLTDEHVAFLSRFVTEVYLSFDSDDAGQKATYKSILMCRKAGLRVKVIQLNVPDAFLSDDKPKPKDPSDIVLFYGKEVLTQIVHSAIIDADYLLFSLTKTYSVDTAEGKAQIALAFFPYIDVLQSDIQKQSCFEQLSHVLGTKLEAVLTDYSRRDSIRERARKRENVQNTNEKSRIDIKKNAEIRAMLAVVANTEFFPLVRSTLSPDDLEDESAKELFYILEECYRDDVVSCEMLLSKCSDENLKVVMSEAITSGEFELNSQQTIQDSIALIRRNSLLRKKNILMNKIRQWHGTSLVEEQALQEMQSEVMRIDNELNKKDRN